MQASETSNVNVQNIAPRKRIGVFCASNKSLDQKYLEEAKTLGRELALAGFDLVWGGCKEASMGAIAEGVTEGGGGAIGVVPQSFIDRGRAYEKATELIVVSDLRERKHYMVKNSEAFIVLPGGFGTLDEFFDVMAIQIVNRKHKEKTLPIAILNSDGFFDGLETLFENLYEVNVAEPWCRELYRFEKTPNDVVRYLQSRLSV